jgi:hypothetical protein
MKPILIPLACASATFFMFALVQFIRLMAFQEDSRATTGSESDSLGDAKDS